MKKNTLLFVHIPKTAGTSFRLAAEDYFEKSNTLLDYNKYSKETSEIILELIYNQKDYYALYKYIQHSNNIFLSGHIFAKKYSRLIDTLNTVSFVRNPVEQVVSHFNHFVRHHNYEHDIKTFIKEKRFKNIQHRLLSGRPLELYGFIGLTEEYETSINIINKIYNIDLKVLKSNIGEKKEISTSEINQDILELIKIENELDFILYKKVKKIFFNHLKCYKNNIPYTYCYLDEINERKVRGVAFQIENDEAIEVEILYNNKLMDIVLAKDERRNLIPFCSKRKGFVGFEYTFSEMVNIDFITLQVKQTGQIIESTLR